MPMYFVLSMKVLLFVGIRSRSEPTPKGAPFYNAYRKGAGAIATARGQRLPIGALSIQPFRTKPRRPSYGVYMVWVLPMAGRCKAESLEGWWRTQMGLWSPSSRDSLRQRVVRLNEHAR